MKRCVISFRDGTYANLEADTLTMHPDDTNIVIARNGTNLVGIFDLSVVMTVYISEKKEEMKKRT